MAVQQARQTRDHYGYHLSALTEAEVQFLWGDYSTALELARQQQDELRSGPFRTMALLAQFLVGRLHFVLGNYEEALAQFDQGESQLKAEDWASEALALFVRWRLRALAFSGKAHLACAAWEKGDSLHGEDLFYRAEAHYLNRDEARALEFLAAVKEPGVLAYPPELPTFRTGYDQLEYRLIRTADDPGVLVQNALGMESYLRGRYQGEAKSLETLNHLMTSQNDGRDPYSHQYALWLALLSYRNSSEASRTTLLGRGLKELQNRGSRIKDRDQRYRFLNHSYWNRIFMDEAKKHKLI